MYQAGWDAREIVGAGGARGAREHQLARPREGVPPLRRAGRGTPLSLLPPQPLVPRLRRLRLARQAQGPHDRRRHLVDEELLREHPDDDLRGPRPRRTRRTSCRTAGATGCSTTGPRQPTSLAAPEMDPASPRHEGYRIPRVVVDICAARPIDLAIIDGIESMGGTEGPWSGGEALPPRGARRRHELRQHRRRGDRGDGLRPDGARGGEPRSTGATTSSSSRRASASAPAT